MTSNLQQLYFDQLGDLYCAEIQLLRMLPQMVAHATYPELKEVLKSHLQETHRHCARLCRISEWHGISHHTVSCETMRTLLREFGHSIMETEPGDVRDGVLIAAANKIEHYEIAGYAVAAAFARCLGFERDVQLIEETEDEEKAVSEALTHIAAEGSFHTSFIGAASHS